jgi:hypothetical protein
MDKVIEKILTDEGVRSSTALAALVAVLMDAGAPWID